MAQKMILVQGASYSYGGTKYVKGKVAVVDDKLAKSFLAGGRFKLAEPKAKKPAGDKTPAASASDKAKAKKAAAEKKKANRKAAAEKKKADKKAADDKKKGKKD